MSETKIRHPVRCTEMATEKGQGVAQGEQTAVNRNDHPPSGKPTEPLQEPTPSAQEERRGRKAGQMETAAGRDKLSKII